jgi:hypothetical protein
MQTDSACSLVVHQRNLTKKLVILLRKHLTNQRPMKIQLIFSKSDKLPNRQRFIEAPSEMEAIRTTLARPGVMRLAQKSLVEGVGVLNCHTVKEKAPRHANGAPMVCTTHRLEFNF